MILNESLQDLVVQSRDGGSLVSHRTLFSTDSKHLFVISGNTVFIYNTSTCACISKIRTPSTEAIANIALAPSPNRTETRLAVCTVRGEIFQVSISFSSTPPTIELLSSQKLNMSPKNWAKPLSSIVNFLYPTPDFFFVLAMTPENIDPIVYSVSVRINNSYLNNLNDDKKDVLLGAPSSAPASKSSSPPTILYLDRLHSDIQSSPHSIACSQDGGFLAAIMEKALVVRDCFNKQYKRHLYGDRKLTCVAVHPFETSCATGDETGRVVLWANPLTSNKPARTIFHWHTLPLYDLNFSVDGSQMLSGGGECTLVKWDTSQTENKRTLPRLGLPIRHVSVSPKNALLAISHADNCIKLVDTQNVVRGTIQNITKCYVPENLEDLDDKVSTETSLGGARVFQAGLVVDPNTSALVMNGKPGQLQCYSFSTDKHLYDLDITRQNYVTAERHGAIPFDEVTHVAFSLKGTWLATSEARRDEDEGIFTEIRLKFWKFEESKQIFMLNTSIEWPHEHGVHSLKIQPINDDDPTLIAVTTGGDRRFKTWGLVHDASIHGKSEWWNCENVGFYRNLSPAGPAAFSPDGSLLAVSFANVLTLWTTESHQLKGALSHQRLAENYTLMEFGNNLSSHLIICASESFLFVWDVITFSLVWAIPFQATSLSVDPLSDIVAVFSAKSHAYLLHADRPEPLARYNNISKSKIISSTFIPYNSNSRRNRRRRGGLKSTLVFINSSQELCAFVHKDDVNEDDEDEEPLLKIQEAEGKTPFAQLIAQKTVSNVPKSSGKGSTQVGLLGAQVIRDIIDASPHTMPSVTFFCDQLLNAVTVKTTASERFEEMENLVLGEHGKNDNNNPENMDVAEYKIHIENDSSQEIKNPNTKNQEIDDEKSKVRESEISVPLDLKAISKDNTTWISTIFV